MPTTVLIAPDQRLLGSALSDLTLYGAQPTAGEAPVRAEGAMPVLPLATLTIPADGETTSPGAPPGAATPSVVATDIPAAVAALTPMAFHDAPMTPLAAPVIPAATPIGAGSFSVQPLTIELHGASPPVAGPAAPEPAATPEPMATTPVSIADAHAATADLIPVAVPLVEQTTGSADHLSEAVQPVTAVGPIVATASDLVPAVADHLAGTLASGAVEPIAATALDVAPATDHLAAALPPVLAPVVDAPTAAAATVTTTVDTIAHAPPVAGLDGLAGSDPAGGIHTLVGMVQTADAFDLSHATSPEAAPSPSIVDTLSADEAPSSLLGDAHHDLAGVGHLADPHSTHLGL